MVAENMFILTHSKHLGLFDHYQFKERSVITLKYINPTIIF